MKKVRLKFLIFLLLLPSITIFITGCWNQRDLNKLAIVSAIGIDKDEDQGVKVTVQIVKPTVAKVGGAAKGGSEDKKAVWILSSKGRTVFDALRNMVKKSGRKLYYPHNYVIILGGQMAKEGVLSIMDWFNRDHEVRPLTWILVTKGNAEDIMRVQSELEKIPADHISRMLKEYGAVSQTVTINLMEFYNQLLSEGTQPVAGRIELKKANGEDELKLEGSGVFRKDRLSGWLDPLETRGYLWIRDKVKSGIVTVPCQENKEKLVSLEIIKASSKIKPLMKKGELHFSIQINVESNLGEQTCNTMEVKAETISYLEDELNAAIKNEIETVINKSQEDFKEDIFGFGMAVMRQYPKEWNELKDNWDETFSRLEIEVVVNSIIRRVGMVE